MTGHISDAAANSINKKLRTVTGSLGTALQDISEGQNLKVQHFDGKIDTNNNLLDSCETLTIDTFDDDEIFKAVLDENFYVKGSASIKLQSLTTATAGDHKAYNEISSADWTGATHILLAVRSNKTLDLGDVQFHIRDSVAGDQTINLPALTSGVTKWVELPLSGKTITAIVEYGFKRNVNEIFNLNVDAMYLIDSTELQTLTETPYNIIELSSITKANTGTHDRTDLVEDTDYILANDTKHIIYLTDQSTKAIRCMYAY